VNKHQLKVLIVSTVDQERVSGLPLWREHARDEGVMVKRALLGLQKAVELKHGFEWIS
jgi:hypothetical protein